MVKLNFSADTKDLKHDIVYANLKDLIIKNELKPGAPLVERQLCSTYNLSRTPVREALRKLAAEGFVEIIPDRGVFVSKIGYEDMLEIFELREALEKMAIRLFIARKTDELMKRLEDCFTQQEQNYRDGNNLVSMQRDMEFHTIYVEGARNNRLIQYMGTIYDHIKRMALRITNDEELMKQAIEQHRKVLMAVKAGDADLAEKRVMEHIQSVKEYHVERYYLLQ